MSAVRNKRAYGSDVGGINVQFQMDCMPGYTKFDRTKKVMAMIQIIGDENITADTNGQSTEPCTELDPAIEEVRAGATDFAADEIDGDTVHQKLSALGSSLKATMDRSNIEFRGRLNAVANWEVYGPADSLTGHYYPFQLKTSATEIKLDTEVGQPDETRGLVVGDAGDYKQLVLAIDPENPIVGIVLDGKSHYTLDFSHVTFR